MNRFYSLQLHTRKKHRKNKKRDIKGSGNDESLEPNYPRCISFDIFDKDISFQSPDSLTYPATSIDDDQLSVLTDDKNRSQQTSEYLTCTYKDKSEPRISHYDELSKSELFLATNGSSLLRVKNYPYLFYDPTHPTMMEILKSQLTNI